MYVLKYVLGWPSSNRVFLSRVQRKATLSTSWNSIRFQSLLRIHLLFQGKLGTFNVFLIYLSLLLRNLFSKCCNVLKIFRWALETRFTVNFVPLPFAMFPFEHVRSFFTSLRSSFFFKNRKRKWIFFFWKKFEQLIIGLRVHLLERN